MTLISQPQQPEINDQFETTASSTNVQSVVKNTIFLEETSASPQPELREYAIQQSFTNRMYSAFATPIMKFISSPKVNTVLRSIGVCIVNGAMEIITYYFPAPLIPLIASAAGMVIPFEPIVLLKEKMPVTSYRRAFRTAVDSFMGTFDRYKMDQDDPYMTRAFNRRLNYDSGEEDKKNIQVLLNKKHN